MENNVKNISNQNIIEPNKEIKTQQPETSINDVTKDPVIQTSNNLRPINVFKDKKPKNRLLIFIIIILIILSSIFAVFNKYRIISWVPVIGYCYVHVKQLNSTYKDEVATLDNLTISSGQKTTATGDPGGDCLTGGNNSPSAQVKFSRTGNLLTVSKDITSNLIKAGYAESESLGTGDVGNGDGNITYLEQKFTKNNNEKITVVYKLNKEYNCPQKEQDKTYICNSKNYFFDVNVLNDQLVDEITATMNRNTLIKLH